MNYILKDENAVYYECGFSCDNEIFLSLGSEKFFITDSRYTLEAKESVKNAEVIETNDLSKTARDIIRKSKINHLIYDSNDFTKHQFDSLSSKLNIFFKDSLKFSQKKRVIKTPYEIEKIQEAAKRGERGFFKLAKFLQQQREPLSEFHINFKTKEILSDFGINELSFNPITAIDENAAKPHSLSTHRELLKNSTLLVDAGVKYQRYCSDRTRTSFFNENITFEKNQKFKSQKEQKIYDTVLKAQESAIKAIKVGMRASEVDKVAREVIQNSSYGEFFIHSTGHGVGLDIHELPRISSLDDTIIEDGMVFTIEPGIYIPNEFGVRIEDMVVIESGEARIL